MPWLVLCALPEERGEEGDQEAEAVSDLRQDSEEETEAVSALHQVSTEEEEKEQIVASTRTGFRYASSFA